MNAQRGMLNWSYKSNFADCLLLMGRLLLSILTDVITCKEQCRPRSPLFTTISKYFNMDILSSPEPQS